ncbi:cytochrome c family protein [Enhygromyxa salina]|uniref:Cytochrome c family protein n=1 Tax=Enhygromyxa salina TaxID=215803 RepID=A0A0C1Z5S2_9BACT|nr:multiheme c-type cytochrome [Enhygromyxa salina]KIG12959.1 cytochrome c family protein [Enhygromyxa salina]
MFVEPRRLPAAATLLGLLAGLGCTPEVTPPTYDLEALRDPETCAECHPVHHREWLGSMHAYAGEDPVFRAMNAKAQRESNGEIGDFCVNCHAPVAVELGLTQDGLNLDTLPREVQGVTCWFCHQVEAVEGTHNNPLRLALNAVMRGDVLDPLAPEAHDVAQSDLFDRNRMASSAMCGSCHDIVTPDGAHIERTYAEWQATFYGDPDPDDPERPALYGLTCNNCHMNKTTGAIADYPGVRGDRSRHSHMFVGVDVAVTDFPDAELGPVLRAEQLAAIEEQRKTSVCASLCVREDGPGAELTVWLHNEGAGHSWPSGAGADRRAWVELIARDDAEAVLYSSGVVTEDQAIAELDDPDLWLLRDRVFDTSGNETHDFWNAASVESNLLPAPENFGGAGDAATWRSSSYVVDSIPARVNMRLRLRPIGLEVLEALVQSGDLDPAVVERASTFDVAPTVLEWTPETATASTGMVDYGSCVSSSPGCGAPALK